MNQEIEMRSANKRLAENRVVFIAKVIVYFKSAYQPNNYNAL